MNKGSEGIVLRGVPDKFPPGAILLSESEATNKQWSMIYNWTPQSEIWNLRYGHAILSTAVGITSMMITSYYRKRFKLGTFGKLTTYIPTVFLPCIISSACHIHFVTTPVLLQNECPICLQMRCSAIQSICSVAIPAILAPLASFGYAYNYATIRLPEITVNNAREYFQIYWKFTRKYQRTLAFMLAGNALLATYVTYKEGSTFYGMHRKMLMERAAIEERVYGNIKASQNLGDKQKLSSANPVNTEAKEA